MPEAGKSAAQFGEPDAGGILPKQVPIVGGLGDSQTLLFAQRCCQPGTAEVTFGTDSSMLPDIGDQLRVSEKGAVTALLGFTKASRPTRSRA